MKLIIIIIFLILTEGIYSTEICKISIDGAIQEFSTTSIKLINKKIKKLKFIEGCKNLVELNLAENELSDLQFSSEFPKIDILDIRGNKLTKLDINDGILINSINASENNIKSINVSAKAKIKSIFLSSNSISDTKNLFENSSLEIIDLSYNLIRNLHVNIENNTLRSIRIENNKLSDCGNLKNLLELRDAYLGGNPIQNCYLPSKIQDLYLQSTGITNLNQLKNSNSIVWLVLSWNNFTGIDGIENYRNLQMLDLRHNKSKIKIPEIYKDKIEISD